MNIAVCTTFPDFAWEVYAKSMLESYVKFWPQSIPILVQLDDDLLYPDVRRILREQDAVAAGMLEPHKAFIERNKDKDDKQNYRKQVVRFCHKVYALHRAMIAALNQKATGEAAPRYLIWWDADVLTTKPVSVDEIVKCLPKEGDAVSYLGRKDWDHSECGFLAFDLESGGKEIIEAMYKVYNDDTVLEMEQWHDSFVFDEIRKPFKCTNLTENKPGMDIWKESPMNAWSVHYKGPIAKQTLANKMVEQPLMPVQGRNFVIQTKNAIPNEEIHAQIKENQSLIKNWLQECLPNDETLVVASAGPLLIAEELKEEVKLGRKIVAVKHALQPLKKAGIKPWACILLDPRPHVADFVKDADPEVKWFVASQVNPQVTKTLLERGCEVWGYHASVGANESFLTNKQPNAVINGGSATATRGLYLLNHLGFKNFHLYGYDLSLADKPDLNALNEFGHPKYMEFSFSVKNDYVDVKRCFYSEPQLMAQFEELQELFKNNKFRLKAFGDGLVPFALKYMNLADLRREAEKCKIGVEITSYKELFKWTKSRRTKSLLAWHKILPIIRQKLRVNIRLLKA